LKILGVIPARYNSTRFPGKPLIELFGKSMIQRVYQQARKSKKLDQILVATDDQRIFDHVNAFGGQAIMTRSDHSSGTDRCQEVIPLLNDSFDYIINVQGDEPLIQPAQIDELAKILDGKIELATQVIRITAHDLLPNPDSVKVVLNENKEALYFSRSPIPFMRNIPLSEWHLKHDYFRHAGMYAYRKDILEKITRLPPSSLETAESLEQLRWLEHGFKIKCIITGHESLAVDTPKDVDVVLKRLKEIEHDQR